MADPAAPSQNIGIDSLLIERATHEHVPYLRRLKLAVMRDRYKPAANQVDFDAWQAVYCTDEYFATLMDNPDVMVLSIGSLREPVGMVVLHHHGDHLELDDLLTLHARRGDGTRLVTAALRYAEVWNVGEVIIDVYPGHAGVEQFLLAHGFERAGDASNDLGRSMHRWRHGV